MTVCSRSQQERCFFFNDTATTEIYTLSLHDALPISLDVGPDPGAGERELPRLLLGYVRGDLYAVAQLAVDLDRKSTRLNSSHANISYAVFCLKKQKIQRAMTLAVVRLRVHCSSTPQF